MPTGVIQRTIFGLAVLPLVLALGCSSPKVSHTSISGEIKDIQHWRLEWVGIDKSPAVDIPGLYEKSKYTAEEYCTRYVEDVKRKLIRTYGRSFAENYPEIGLIQVELLGEKLPAYVPPPREGGASGGITWEDRDGETRAVYRPDSVGQSYLFGRDQVRQVSLRFFDATGTRFGDVFIGESYSDNVKPDFVAGVIDEIIRTGRYKGTKVPPVSSTVEGK